MARKSTRTMRGAGDTPTRINKAIAQTRGLGGDSGAIRTMPKTGKAGGKAGTESRYGRSKASGAMAIKVRIAKGGR